MKRLFILLTIIAAAMTIGCANFDDTANALNPDGTVNSGSSGTGGTVSGVGATSVSIGNLIYVPAGSFQRDSTSTNISILTTSFLLSEKEITRQQYIDVTGLSDTSDTTKSTGINDPVQRVNWYDTLVFCNKLSIAEGLTPAYSIIVSGSANTNPDDWIAANGGIVPGATSSNAVWDAVVCNWNADGYRLPTITEMGWAVRGASSDSRSGDINGGVNTLGWQKGYAGSSETAQFAHANIGDYVWYNLNSGVGGTATAPLTTHPVGTKLPNELGLYDMSGNVSEWCWDCYAIQVGTMTDYKGPISSPMRTTSSSTFNDSFNPHLLVYFNSSMSPPYGRANSSLGFRVARSH